MPQTIEMFRQVSCLSTDNKNEAAHRGAKWIPSAGKNKQFKHLLGLNNNNCIRRQ
jgi:hypothetical protein